MASLDTPLRRFLGSLFWLVLYLAVTLAPLSVAFIYRDHPRREFWTEFSVALGFVGLSMLSLQFLITARFRGVAAPYGIDILLRFHRQISLLVVGLVVAHPVILFVTRPETVRLLNVVEAPWRARAAVAALVAMLVLVSLSFWRRRFGLGYETWRLTHGLLAVGALVLALIHVQLVGWYIDLPWKRVLWVLLIGMVVLVLVYVRIVRPHLLKRRPYRVSEVRPERGSAHTLVFEPVNHRAMRFSPGQFAWLTLDRTPLLLEDHPFSFSSSAYQRDKVAMTIKKPGDFTSTVGDIPVGAHAYLEGPHGAFTIDRYEGPGYVFVAGGVGITPIMSMLRSLDDRRDGRAHLLLYAAGTYDDLTFREDIDDIATRLDLEVVYVPGEPHEGWQGPSGRISYELLLEYVDGERADHRYFICGPNPMMDDIEQKLLRAGVPPERIASERFNLV